MNCHRRNRPSPAPFLAVLGVVFASAVPAAADDPKNFCLPPGENGVYLTFPSGSPAPWAIQADGTILRANSPSTNGHGSPSLDRRPVTTLAADFLSGDFALEVVVHQAYPGGDIFFLGVGDGTTELPHQEYPNAAYFRFHVEGGPGSGFQNTNQIDIALRNPLTSNFWEYIARHGTSVPGADHTLRIERAGDDLTLSIDGQGKKTFSVASQLGGLSATNSYIQFSNTTPSLVIKSFCVAAPATDSDGDGIPDAEDQCAGTASGATVDLDGCSGAQNVGAACDGSASWKNHGQYVSCVSKAAEAQVAAGLLTDAEKDAIVSAAAQSGVGKKK